jgi:hypothetical protein
MWGLGHYIYAGEDLPDADAKEEKPVGKKPEPKKEEPVKEEPKQEDDFDYNEAWANAFVDGFLKVVTIAETPEEVKGQYKANAEQIKVLKDKFPDQKKRLDDLSLQYVENLKESSKEVK